MIGRVATAAFVFLLFAILIGPVRAAPPYLLTPDEISAFRPLGAEDSYSLFRGKHGEALVRVLKDIADKRGGKYSGYNWSVYETFRQFMSGPPDATIILEDRFLAGRGCRHMSCPEKAAFIIDLHSGHVAFALLHYYTAEKSYLGYSPAVTQFMKSCVNPELRSFAAQYFVAWAESELMNRKTRSETLNSAESKTLTTRC